MWGVFRTFPTGTVTGERNAGTCQILYTAVWAFHAMCTYCDLHRKGKKLKHQF